MCGELATAKLLVAIPILASAFQGRSKAEVKGIVPLFYNMKNEDARFIINNFIKHIVGIKEGSFCFDDSSMLGQAFVG